MHVDGDEPPDIAFGAGVPEVVATRDDRNSAGLHHWIDGTMGLVREGDRTLVVAPNGRNLARHEIRGEAGLLDSIADADQAIVGCPPDVEHASGGPLFRDDETGALLLVYHGELFLDGDHERFYSFLGLAVSTDDGATFVDTGRVITSEVEESNRAAWPVELGPGAAVRVGEDLRLYFTERGVDSQRLRLAVASARFRDVVSAALAGTTPSFRKWYRGRFASPGIGGPADDLLAGAPFYVGWFDVAWLADPELMVLVFSTVPHWAEGDHRWNHFGCGSVDGIRWSGPVPLYDEPFEGEMLYLSIDSGGPDQRVVRGDRFDVYRVCSTTPYRWDDAWVDRVGVTWRVDDPAPRR